MTPWFRKSKPNEEGFFVPVSWQGWITTAILGALLIAIPLAAMTVGKGHSPMLVTVGAEALCVICILVFLALVVAKSDKR